MVVFCQINCEHFWGYFRKMFVFVTNFEYISFAKICDFFPAKISDFSYIFGFRVIVSVNFCVNPSCVWPSSDKHGHL